jgi:hypothetical protein
VREMKKDAVVQEKEHVLRKGMGQPKFVCKEEN